MLQALPRGNCRAEHAASLGADGKGAGSQPCLLEEVLYIRIFTSILWMCTKILAWFKTSKLPLISNEIMAHWSDSMRPENLVQHLYFEKVRRCPYTITTKGYESLFISHVRPRNCSPLSRLPPDRRFSEHPSSREKHIGNLWLLKLWPVLASDSPAHPKEPERYILLFILLWFPIPSPVPAWTGWQ